MLEIPFVSYVSKVEEINNGHMIVQRMVEEGHEVVETTLPALITVAKEINVPRLPSLRGLTKAKKAVIPAWGAQEIEAEDERIGLNGSATKVIKIFYPQRVRSGEMLQGSQEEQAESLINKLKEAKLI